MVLFYPVLFLSGTTIPRQAFPPTLRSFSEFLPLTHVVELVRGLWFGQAWSEHLTAVAVLVGMLVMGTAISARTFRWE